MLRKTIVHLGARKKRGAGDLRAWMASISSHAPHNLPQPSSLALYWAAYSEIGMTACFAYCTIWFMSARLSGIRARSTRS
jgi:hypothetical protein